MTREPHGGVGVPGTFTFSPPAGWLEVAAYQYLLPGASDYLMVPAGPDGRAGITFAPEASDWNTIEVFSVRADGTLSDYSGIYSFFVG